MLISLSPRLLDDAVGFSRGLFIGTRGTRISFSTRIPDRFRVVTVLCVFAFANTSESGPIALVRRRLLGGPVILKEKCKMIRVFASCFKFRPHVLSLMFSVFFFLIFPLMSNVRKVRSDCRYNEEELSKILQYKSEFISASIEERIKILQNDICPKMFNYWEDIGRVFTVKESKLLTKV